MKLAKKYKFFLFIPLILFIILSLIYYNKQTENEVVINEPILEVATFTDTKTELKKLKVDIKGAIKKPGVYEIIEGSRVIDVVGVSGGFNYNAYTHNINLSKILKDEDVIIIYTNEEIEGLKKSEVIIEYIEKDCPIISCEEKCDYSTIENSACIKEENIITNVDTINRSVNLNTATKEELMTLSSIGESKAELIIEYRNKSKFKSIEEIKNIKGIGEAIYDKIKDFIKV